MAFDMILLKKAFSPKTLVKAGTSFDNSMLVVIVSCWMAAVVAMGLAAFAVNGAVEWQSKRDKAMLSEPILPNIRDSLLGAKELSEIEERLKLQFPNLTIAKSSRGSAGELTIKANIWDLFQQWIYAIGYVDSMNAQYKWELKEFCAGDCKSGRGLMYVSLVGKSISIEKGR